jgi:osmoprotectant transport system permease protein
MKACVYGALAIALIVVAPSHKADAQSANTTPTVAALSRQPVVVASKPFGESYLLAEMFAQLLEAHGLAVERRPGLGSTEVAFRALRTDAIDVYPEYTGTGLIAVLRDSATADMRADSRLLFAHVARRFFSQYGVQWLPPLGFSNGYAIAVRRETAERFRLRTLSDLAREGGALSAGFTSDFIGRSDGFAGLSREYGLQLESAVPLSPAVKYEALANGDVDVIDGYTTDGLLARYDLVVLIDDRHFFPPYDAAAIVSPRIARSRPDVVGVLSRLSGRLPEVSVREWNRRIEVERVPIPDVARAALEEIALVGRGGETERSADGRRVAQQPNGFWSFLLARRAETIRLTVQHAVLVSVAMLAAVMVALPLGIWLTQRPRTAAVVMQVLGIFQTIPSIALLAFMLPLFGIGSAPALVALWLYALLPIVRATYTGVATADPDAVAASEALGMTHSQRLWRVQLPLASPAVLGGIRTAAVITVGAATLAAFIGAGGLGEPIVTGLALADSRLVLSGALPAALLAIVVDACLATVQRYVAPRGRP